MSDTLDRSFLGRGWAFPPAFSRRGGTEMIEADQDIEESLLILLKTRLGERVMHPDYGSDLHRLVFETISASLVTDIRDMIERAILFFEPRIKVERVAVGTERSTEGILEIQITYLILATNTRNNIVYPFYFDEGSHVHD